MFDIVIIGAGITGTMLAKDLSRYSLSVALVDKENDIAEGATMANSAIVHTGYDPVDGTLKAKLNVLGAQLYPQLCKDLHCVYRTVGAYIAAVGEEEEKHLDVLADRADRRGIPYEWLSGEQARKEEPNLSENVTKVLNFYTTAVIYPWQVALKCAQVAVKNGVQLYLNEEVKSIERQADSFKIHTTTKNLESKWIINASGIEAEHIYRMLSEDCPFKMMPKKGEYFVLDQDVDLVKHIIFPVPSKAGKGVLAVPTVYGNTLIGPNAQFMEEEINVDTTAEGLGTVRKNISKTLNNVPFQKAIRTFSGLRPSSSSDDFIIEESKIDGLINVVSIESPGLASSPGISQYVIGEILSHKMDLVEKEDAVLKLDGSVVMSELSDEERQAKIAENPLYGKIICRCEQISEGEIVDCIHESIGARSVRGVKKRVRPGMGRCQGGFCEPKVVNILARELGCSPLDVLQDNIGSNILKEEK